MIGFTELASLDLSESHPIKDNLDEVLKAGNRAKALIQQMLSFTQPTDQEKRLIEVVLIVDEAMTIIRASLPTTIDIKLNIQIDSGAILADPTQIQQVLINLVSNAGYEMKDSGGTLELGLSRIEMDDETSSTTPDVKLGTYLLLKVSDTGPGMDTQTLDRIFEPFFTTKGPGEGSGMGLAVVHGIVKNHGGAITVQSEPGQGSTFEVYLPLVDEAEAEAQIETEDNSLPKGSERILFIDDEESIAKLSQKMLERLGYDVTGLKSSQEALELFQGQPDSFDLVITDMTMPSITGLVLAKEVIEIRPDIPVILCTGYSEQVTPVRIQALGIKRLLMKPLAMKEVATAVRTVLDEQTTN